MSGRTRRSGRFGRNLFNSDAVRHGTVHPDVARQGTVHLDTARDGICLPDGMCQGMFLLDAAMSGHFPSEGSHIRAFSFWTQPCQGKWGLDDMCHGAVGKTSHCLSYGVGMSGAKQGAQQESGEAAQ